MENVKAGHLSYIGDATISNNVNIGAGTVFCNYDGKNKHRSFVGEKVFIGSNSSIISPVKIDSRSTIAAGSVITKDVEKNALAIARSKQINLRNKSKIS
jgi:bifunctional UDP-N-acetylglucosamine pyrophosphorylase/glucosamine-1-phosphate N-acetyltransferase